MRGTQSKIVSAALLLAAALLAADRGDARPAPARGAKAAPKSAPKPAAARDRRDPPPQSTAVPVAAPAQATGSPARPIGNPADWFPADAYPPEARNAGAEGRTVFSLDIDPAGRIVRCNIVASSGSEQLDNTTCDLLVVNGRFQPARDATGKAVAGTWSSGMRWKIVQDSPTFEDGPTP